MRTTPVLVDANGFDGRWAVSYSTAFRLGSATITLVPSIRYWMRVGYEDGFYFDVDASGNVSSSAAASVLVAGSTLQFRTTLVIIDANGFEGRWELAYSWIFRNDGLAIVNLVPAMRYKMRIGYHGDLSFNVDTDGHVSSASTAPVVVSDNILQLQTIPVTIDPGTYAGKWEVAYSGLFRAGSATLKLVPAILYELRLANNAGADLFYFQAPCEFTPQQLVFDNDTFSFNCPPSALNHLPVAHAGLDQTVAAGADCQAVVTLDSTGSGDPDGDALTYTWQEGPTLLGSGPTPTVQLGFGAHEIILTVDDGNGGTSSDMVVITVIDTTPPTLACPADITLPCSVDLLVPVNYTASASDNCDSAPQVTYTPLPGSGFPVGDTTVTCTATDASGNSSVNSFQVTRAPLGFNGFLSPIGGADDYGGSYLSPKRTFKLNSTIPVKFTSSCGDGPVLTRIHRLQVAKYTDTTTTAPAIDATPQDAATTGNQFRLTDNEWHFNLDTKAVGMSAGIWLLTTTLSDGSQHTVWIQLK